MVDAFEEAIEQLQAARKRAEIRRPAIEEARDAIDGTAFVVLEGYLGFGRVLRCTEAVKAALKQAAAEELDELQADLERAEGRIKVDGT